MPSARQLAILPHTMRKKQICSAPLVQAILYQWSIEGSSLAEIEKSSSMNIFTKTPRRYWKMIE